MTVATNDQDLIISIQADSKKAVESLDAVRTQLEQMNATLDASQDHLKKTEESLSGFGLAVVKVNEGIELAQKAFEAMHKVFEETVQKFIEADDIVKGLSNTLELLGEKNVAGATAHFKEFAEELEHHSTVSEEATLKLITLAKAMGRTDEQAQSLARTSANLSAVNGESLQSNFEKLNNTFKGVTRGVEVYDTSIKNLTESQIRNGAALAVLDKDFQGFAEKQLNTIGGQAKQVQILLEHTLEDVGGLFAAFFKLDDRSFMIQAIKEVNEAIKSLKPTIVEIRQNIDDFIAHFVNGFNAVKDKAETLKETFTLLGVVILASVGPSAIKALVAFATAQAPIVAGAIATAAGFAAIAVEVTGVVVAIDLLIRNTKNLLDFFSTVLDALLQGFVDLAKAVVNIFSLDNLKAALTGDRGFFDQMAEDITGSFTKAFDNVKKSAIETFSNFDFGLIDKFTEGAANFTEGFNKALDPIPKKIDAVTEATGRARSSIVTLSKEAQQAFDNLSKKVEELKLKQTELGGDTNQIAAQRLALELKQIDVLEKELKDRGGLNKAAQDLLKTARETATANSGIEVYEKQRKALLDISEKTKDLQLGVDSFNKTQAEVIDLQLTRQMELLDLKAEELKSQMPSLRC